MDEKRGKRGVREWMRREEKGRSCKRMDEKRGKRRSFKRMYEKREKGGLVEDG